MSKYFPPNLPKHVSFTSAGMNPSLHRHDHGGFTISSSLLPPHEYGMEFLSQISLAIYVTQLPVKQNNCDNNMVTK